MKYYRSTVKVDYEYEFDPSYTIAVNNDGNIIIKAIKSTSLLKK